MPNKPVVRIINDIFQTRDKQRWESQPHGGVGQDKNALTRERMASRQPVTDADDRRTLPRNGKVHPAKARHSTSRKREYVMLWVEPVVKSELERRAKRNNLSLSATGGALLQSALQNQVDMEYSAL